MRKGNLRAFHLAPTVVVEQRKRIAEILADLVQQANAEEQTTAQPASGSPPSGENSP